MPTRVRNRQQSGDELGLQESQGDQDRHEGARGAQPHQQAHDHHHQRGDGYQHQHLEYTLLLNRQGVDGKVEQGVFVGSVAPCRSRSWPAGCCSPGRTAGGITAARHSQDGAAAALPDKEIGRQAEIGGLGVDHHPVVTVVELEQGAEVRRRRPSSRRMPRTSCAGMPA